MVSVFFADTVSANARQKIDFAASPLEVGSTTAFINSLTSYPFFRKQYALYCTVAVAPVYLQ